MTSAWRGVGRGVRLGLVGLLLCACAVRVGAPVSVESWESETDKVLGAALSSLGTADILLDAQSDGDLPGPYVAVSLRDTIETLDKEASAYRLTQPPETKVSENRQVLSQLEHALVVLNNAATAGSASDIAARDAAREEVDEEYDAVDALLEELVGP